MNKTVCKCYCEKCENRNIVDEKYLKPSCLSIHEMFDYLKSNNGYAWHISNLVIFDKPKELSEFRQKWYCKGLEKYMFHPIGKAPQSFCYIEIGE